jgi:hypothetical protein
MRRAALLLLIGVAGCAAPRVEQVPPPQTRTLLPSPAVPRQADFVLVDKSDRTLTLFSRGVPIKSYVGV